MKRIICLSIVVLSAIYIVSAQMPDSLNFFPVHAGDVRQYHSQFTGDLISTEYTDSVIVDSLSKDIFVFGSGAAPWKIDSLGNVYDKPWQSTYIRYKLYADSGDSWQAGVFNDSAVIATVVYIGPANIFGINTTIKAIRFTVQEYPPPHQPFSFGTDYLAKGFGRVESQVEPSDIYILTGAIIDSVQFGVITEVKKEIELPHVISLFQNYPNPFNPSTVISYQLQTISHVTLKVYDMLGREAVTLVDGTKEAGYYTATFHGDKLANGIYFARIIASPEDGGKSFTKTMKMLMMK